MRSYITEALVGEILLAFGLGKAAHSKILRRIAARFIRSVRVRGRQNLPGQGLLLAASNHPGALDSVSMLGAFPRDDPRIFVSGSPFFKTIPSSSEHCIFVEDPANVDERRRAIRLGIEHLRQGGSLLIFPTGRVDPEPAFSSGSLETMRQWSPSLEILLRKAPHTRLVLAVASDVLMHKYAAHPLTHLQPPGWKRQRVGEYLQVIQLLLSRQILALDTLISIGAPAGVGYFEGQRWMGEIICRAQALYTEHMTARAGGFRDGEDLW